jgi:hypothetical protein
MWCKYLLAIWRNSQKNCTVRKGTLASAPTIDAARGVVQATGSGITHIPSLWRQLHQLLHAQGDHPGATPFLDPAKFYRARSKVQKVALGVSLSSETRRASAIQYTYIRGCFPLPEPNHRPYHARSGLQRPGTMQKIAAAATGGILSRPESKMEITVQ